MSMRQSARLDAGVTRDAETCAASRAGAPGRRRALPSHLVNLLERDAELRARALATDPMAPMGLRRSPVGRGSARLELGEGRPIDESTRAYFEPRLGRGLGVVRLHTGPEAARIVARFGGEAFAFGHHVVFGAGRYAPSTSAGRHLVAHELTHVIQQEHGEPYVACRGPMPAPVLAPAPPIVRTVPSGPQAPGGAYREPIYAHEPGRTQTFEESWREFSWMEMVKNAPPIATLDRGASSPPFVTTVTVGPQLRAQGPASRVDPHWEAAFQSGRRLHVLDAIEYDVANARSVQDLEQVLINYLDYEPEPMRPDIYLPPLRSRRTVRILFPPDFDPGGERMKVFADALAKKVELGEELQKKAAQAPTPLETMLLPAKKPAAKKPVEVTLRLPSYKAAHLRLYQGLIGALQHDLAYERERNAQSGRWDSGMDPRSGEGMYSEVYERGLRMGLTRDRIFRPNWSRDAPTMPMQVDHMVELQVLPPAQVEAWGDTFVNYELLDALSNGLSGGQLKNNIRKERVDLAQLTGDPLWLTRRLDFTRVVAEPGPGGHRWVAEEIRVGEHLRAWRKHRGELGEGR